MDEKTRKLYDAIEEVIGAYHPSENINLIRKLQLAYRSHRFGNIENEPIMRNCCDSIGDHEF